MSKYMTKFNAYNLVEKLSKNGFANDKDLSDFIINQREKEGLALYFKPLITIATFLLTLCFILFFLIFVYSNKINISSFGLWGLFFIGCAILSVFRYNDSNTLQNNFILYFSLVMMGSGKFIIMLASYIYLDKNWGFVLGLFTVTICTYHIYPISIDRFLSSFAILFLIFTNILSLDYKGYPKELLFNIFFLIQIIFAAVLLTNQKVNSNYVPIFYSLVCSICVNILFLSSYRSYFFYWTSNQLIYPGFTNFVLTIALIALFAWAAGGLKKLRSEPLILASISVVLLGYISVSGILLAIGLMILGYAKHERILIAIGIFFMGIFLFSYYYNLDISLIKKSAILIGNGIVLLLMRIYLKYKAWDNGDMSCV